MRGPVRGSVPQFLCIAHATHPHYHHIRTLTLPLLRYICMNLLPLLVQGSVWDCYGFAFYICGVCVYARHKRFGQGLGQVGGGMACYLWVGLGKGRLVVWRDWCC